MPQAVAGNTFKALKGAIFIYFLFEGKYGDNPLFPPLAGLQSGSDTFEIKTLFQAKPFKGSNEKLLLFLICSRALPLYEFFTLNK